MINTEKTVGYINKLTQATPNMKLGLNNDVHKETKKWVAFWWKADLQKFTRQIVTLPIQYTKCKVWESKTGAAHHPTPSLPPAATRYGINKALLVVGAVFFYWAVNLETLTFALEEPFH